MFILNEDFKGFQVGNPEIVSILHSINEPKIAAADRPAEPTQAFICMSTQKDKKFHAHIVLYLTKSQIRVAYAWEDGPFSKDKRTEVEGEALDFVENMGFMMDNLNLEKLTSDQKINALKEVPIFQLKVEAVEEMDEEPLISEIEEDEIPTRTRPKETPALAAKESDRDLGDFLFENPTQVTNEVVNRNKTNPLPKASPKPKVQEAPKIELSMDSEPFVLEDDEFQRPEESFNEGIDSFAAMLDAGESKKTTPPTRESVSINPVAAKPPVREQPQQTREQPQKDMRISADESRTQLMIRLKASF